MNRLATFAGYAGFVLLGWNAVLVPALIRSIQPDFRQARHRVLLGGAARRSRGVDARDGTRASG
jgi:hypothetical protein